MAANNPPLTPQSLSAFSEGIYLVLSRWTALQMAIQNEWGGRDSRQKSDQFSYDILSWFTQTKEPLYIDDLEEKILFKTMTDEFNVVLDDGSEKEIAEELMIMHEECLQENYESIQRLRISSNGAQAVSQSRQLVDENVDESSDDEEASDMAVDEPQGPSSNSKTNNTSVDNQNQTGQADDGWSVVPPRRNKGNRQN
ncbi:hypothetical protein C5167_020744 [Papaver somniferum]|uniref:Pre-rRNA-processing protein TSR2 homolog n=1 Tax=Papaver somniferum TaxID=3469 RepID=A0A4Y7ITX5_PAPSO|nr:pre-rRNA-processing protein TSR2 homolog [Papaver somniferum]RZC52324.1 hypothetical protein C5167_020744 [Papaver somniferum]